MGAGSGKCQGEGCGKKGSMGPSEKGMGTRAPWTWATRASKAAGCRRWQSGHGMGSMAGGSEDVASPGTASAAVARIAERGPLLREITTHSLHLEGLADPEELAGETVKHQQMLDRLMGLMQE